MGLYGKRYKHITIIYWTLPEIHNSIILNLALADQSLVVLVVMLKYGLGD
jgi:hypothetical protein